MHLLGNKVTSQAKKNSRPAHSTSSRNTGSATARSMADQHCGKLTFTGCGDPRDLGWAQGEGRLLLACISKARGSVKQAAKPKEISQHAIMICMGPRNFCEQAILQCRWLLGPMKMAGTPLNNLLLQEIDTTTAKGSPSSFFSGACGSRGELLLVLVCCPERQTASF